ncbi:uncharacterized protein CANTADRAFT_4065 [Suhomyces tanzawaensis NRRL Y-17324]|uniref:Uncharacterized protein n=1 Tax=Suhomyces tanzawaensis NRRL Y-17324 TaxID=984487 RepID=A0A1E4SRE8_9ASCO|nr:uncharacterized protein CANTADRAFT_4065 [Suhomyces tanzawaensis NRRL Y-17324]ODV82017.1 hypothetical protein CANTADRAFT_4065 [Suhomyces tanzawaensis NRRL Y-17324]
MKASAKATKPKPLKPLAQSFGWIKQLEYIDINLNNSRKLIQNLDNLSNSTTGLVNDVDMKVNGGMIGVQRVKAALDWLD